MILNLAHKVPFRNLLLNSAPQPRPALQNNQMLNVENRTVRVPVYETFERIEMHTVYDRVRHLRVAVPRGRMVGYRSGDQLSTSH